MVQKSGPETRDDIIQLIADNANITLEAGKTKINVIPCENALLCGDMLKKEIIATGLITEAEVDQIAAIPNTAVDRMVFGTQRDDRDGIEAGKDHELAVEVNKLVNPEELPIKGAEYTDNLQKYLERKLYTINCGHAWSGYVAHVMGYEIIQDYFADEKNVELTRSVMLEVAALLEAKHGFTLVCRSNQTVFMSQFTNWCSGNTGNRVGDSRC